PTEAPAAGPRMISADDWENSLRPSLRGMPRAIYAPAGFISSSASTLSLSVPNAVHRGKCEEHRAAVEAVVSEFAGGKVTLELVAGDGDGGGGGSTTSSSAPSIPASPTIAPTGDPGPSEPSGPPPESPRAAAERRALEQVEEHEPAPVVSELPHDDEVDLDSLVDAPPESVKTPIERLAEAFPGSELIEEAG
ncbi:MAG: hypothetical protein WBP59_11055, partial [Ilumatobacteraceae bacterium]